MSEVSQQSGVPHGNTYYILRHGEAEQNVLGIVYGKDDDDYALTSDGRDQVKAAVAKLSGITKIYASPVRRARESAEIAADALRIPLPEIIFDKRLRELNFGDFQGKGIGDFIRYRNENMKTLAERFPGGESYLDAKRRFGAWLYETDTKHQNEHILVVTHGIGIESLVSAAKGMSNDETLQYVRHHTFEYAHLASFAFQPLSVNEDFELVS